MLCTFHGGLATQIILTVNNEVTDLGGGSWMPWWFVLLLMCSNPSVCCGWGRRTEGWQAHAHVTARCVCSWRHLHSSVGAQPRVAPGTSPGNCTHHGGKGWAVLAGWWQRFMEVAANRAAQPFWVLKTQRMHWGEQWVRSWHSDSVVT